MTITLHNLIGIIAGEAYTLAPNHSPRKIEIVMDKVRNYLKDNLNQPIPYDKSFYCKEFEEDKIYGFIHDMMFSIPEFLEWNLTQIEYEDGISVDDESRPKFCFVSGYDVIEEDDWKNDFIDLDAFVQNVCYKVKILYEE